MKIIFATNNRNKLLEIRQVVGESFELLSLDDVGLDAEIPETGRTLEANAMQKAMFVFERFRQPVFADDTGLEVSCLDGKPGVDTAHYSGKRDPQANMDKLLREVRGCDDRSACFKTVIAFVSPEHKELFTGEVRGMISTEKRGSEGFGYDPLFFPEGSSRTFAEMSMEEKSRTNHRVRAFAKLKDFLESLSQ